MQEIKVGEYVRSRQGYIAKVIKIEEDYGIEFNKSIIRRYGEESDMLFLNPEYTYEDERSEIIKQSQNIIDLIEVGDYVNGYKVSFKGNDYKPFVQCDYPVKQGATNHYLFYEEAIENIVTKEQFNSIKYTIVNLKVKQENTDNDNYDRKYQYQIDILEELLKGE